MHRKAAGLERAQATGLLARDVEGLSENLQQQLLPVRMTRRLCASEYHTNQDEATTTEHADPVAGLALTSIQHLVAIGA